MNLNLGCGGQFRAGWVNVDRAFDDFAPVDGKRKLQWDLRETPWPWEYCSADLAAFHHVLDLFTPTELHRVLTECWRILRPGGAVRISSPDFSKASAALCDRDLEYFTRLGVPEDDLLLAFDWYFHWGGARKTPLASEETAAGFLHDAGFDVYRNGTEPPAVSELYELDSREDESWFLTAVKPG